MGLSLHARSHLSEYEQRNIPSGTIPARTELPDIRLYRPVRVWDYPHAHGATALPESLQFLRLGLSPRARSYPCEKLSWIKHTIHVRGIP